jgi:hypothetical protein
MSDIKNRQKKSLGIILLSLIALFLSAGSFIFVAIDFFKPADEVQPSIIFKGMNWAQGPTMFHIPDSISTKIPNMVLDDSLESGEVAKIIFTADVELDTTGGVQIQIQFRMNSTFLMRGLSNLFVPSIGGVNITLPIYASYLAYASSAIKFNLTISVFSDTAFSTLYNNKLELQKFKI